MYDTDRDNLDIFFFYMKLPSHEQRECEIFITPEKIYQIKYGDLTAINDIKNKLKYMRDLPTKELRDSVESRGEWPYYTMFNRVVGAIKEYMQLRPAVIEKYPEFLI